MPERVDFPSRFGRRWRESRRVDPQADIGQGPSAFGYANESGLDLDRRKREAARRGIEPGTFEPGQAGTRGFDPGGGHRIASARRPTIRSRPPDHPLQLDGRRRLHANSASLGSARVAQPRPKRHGAPLQHHDLIRDPRQDVRLVLDDRIPHPSLARRGEGLGHQAPPPGSSSLVGSSRTGYFGRSARPRRAHELPFATGERPGSRGASFSIPTVPRAQHARSPTSATGSPVAPARTRTPRRPWRSVDS